MNKPQMHYRLLALFTLVYFILQVTLLAAVGVLKSVWQLIWHFQYETSINTCEKFICTYIYVLIVCFRVPKPSQFIFALATHRTPKKEHVRIVIVWATQLSSSEQHVRLAEKQNSGRDRQRYFEIHRENHIDDHPKAGIASRPFQARFIVQYQLNRFPGRIKGWKSQLRSD